MTEHDATRMTSAEMAEHMRSVREQPGGCVEVRYREIYCDLPANWVAEADALLARMPRHVRRRVIAEVVRCLCAVYGKIVDQTASQLEADEFARDVAIWAAAKMWCDKR